MMTDLDKPSGYREWAGDLSWCRHPLDAATPAGVFHVLVRQWYEEKPEELGEWLRGKLMSAPEYAPYAFDVWSSEDRKTYRVFPRGFVAELGELNKAAT